MIEHKPVMLSNRNTTLKCSKISIVKIHELPSKLNFKENQAQKWPKHKMANVNENVIIVKQNVVYKNFF